MKGSTFKSKHYCVTNTEGPDRKKKKSYKAHKLLLKNMKPKRFDLDISSISKLLL